MEEKLKALFETLPPSEETGRFFVNSFRTGKKYLVEPIDSAHTKWGDVDPVTKKLTGDYGEKYKGGIEKSESVITEENGFINIEELNGKNYMDAIEEIDKQYPDAPVTKKQE